MELRITSDSLANGSVLRPPPGPQAGYWAGAPGAYYEPSQAAWYLTYRLRRPRGIAPDRGGEARIARSQDLQNWTDVWSVTKDQFASASIERCALRKGTDGQWRYFPSFVDSDGRWCVALLRASDLQKLDPRQARPLFKGAPLGLEGVKDPWIFEAHGTYIMILSIALPTSHTGAKSHATHDIFNTGECVSASGLATSTDLDHWDWQGVVFRPFAPGWDAYCRRINSIVPHEGKYFAFYDGSSSHEENYEEKTGLAVSSDLRTWDCLTPGGPLFSSPHASGSLRYVDVQIHGNQALLFYESARADGAHDLRLAIAPASGLPFEVPGLSSTPHAS